MDGSQMDRRGEALAAVRGLAPVVAAHRDAFDRERRLPAPVAEALVAADLLRLWAPAGVGGPGLGAADMVDVVEEAAALDATVGWIVTNAAIMSRGAAFLPPEVAREWWGTPDAFCAGSTGATGTARPAPGGFRVSGRWPFASGVQAARRIMGLAAVEGAEGAGEVLCVYVPREAATVHDTWHVSGLRGTGSCDWSLDDVFVPAAHAHRLEGDAPRHPGRFYRWPVGAAFSLSVGLVPLGIARGAIADLVALAGRTRRGTARPLRERETVQADVARADALRRAAKALVREALADLEAALDEGGEALLRARLAFRVALAHGAESCQRAVHLMAACAGSSAILESHPLERRVRDVDAAVKHVAMGPHVLVEGGRLLLGLDPVPPGA